MSPGTNHNGVLTIIIFACLQLLALYLAIMPPARAKAKAKANAGRSKRSGTSTTTIIARLKADKATLKADNNTQAAQAAQHLTANQQLQQQLLAQQRTHQEQAAKQQEQHTAQLEQQQLLHAAAMETTKSENLEDMARLEMQCRRQGAQPRGA
jgi:hypothetical protein